jgi:hypothetical protein
MPLGMALALGSFDGLGMKGDLNRILLCSALLDGKLDGLKESSSLKDSHSDKAITGFIRWARNKRRPRRASTLLGRLRRRVRRSEGEHKLQELQLGMALALGLFDRLQVEEELVGLPLCSALVEENFESHVARQT